MRRFPSTALRAPPLHAIGTQRRGSHAHTRYWSVLLYVSRPRPGRGGGGIPVARSGSAVEPVSGDCWCDVSPRLAQQEAAADAARVPGAGFGPKSSPAPVMLDFFTIFSKGGLVLWCFQGVSDSCTGPVNALIRSVLLQVPPPRGRTPG